MHPPMPPEARTPAVAPAGLTVARSGAGALEDAAQRGRAEIARRALEPGPATGRTDADLDVANARVDSVPPKTLRAYQLGQRRFADWCAAQGVPHDFPARAVRPEALAAFVDAMAAEGLKPATVNSYVAAVSAMHRALDLPSPAAARIVTEAKRAQRRAAGSDQAQAPSMTRDYIDAALGQLGDGLADLRDGALLSVAYDTGARADELVGLDVGDVMARPIGAAVRIRRSKTDQEGRGQERALADDTLRRVRAWIAAAGLDREPPEGTALFQPLSRKAQGERLLRRDVARIFTRRVGRDAEGRAFSAHSPRVGVTNDLRSAGFTNSDIAQALGWKGDAMPARYTRHHDAQQSATAQLARRQGR